MCLERDIVEWRVLCHCSTNAEGYLYHSYDEDGESKLMMKVRAMARVLASAVYCCIPQCEGNHNESCRESIQKDMCNIPVSPVAEVPGD